jgi:hypothetical protein
VEAILSQLTVGGSRAARISVSLGKAYKRAPLASSVPVLTPIEDAAALSELLQSCRRLKEVKGERGSAELYACGGDYLVVVHSREGGSQAGFSRTLVGAYRLVLQAFPELGWEAEELALELLSD